MNNTERALLKARAALAKSEAALAAKTQQVKELIEAVARLTADRQELLAIVNNMPVRKQ